MLKNEDEMTVATNLAIDVIGLSTKWEFSVTSWIRTAARNKMVGGVEDSQHLTGTGIDVVLDKESDKPRFITECVTMGWQVIDETDHLHIQLPHIKAEQLPKT